VIPLLPVALPLQPPLSCLSDLPIYREASSRGFPQLWPKGEFVCPALPDSPQPRENQKKWEQRVLARTFAIAEDGSRAQLLPGQNIPGACYAIVSSEEKNSFCISSKPHSSHLSCFYSCPSELTPDPPFWQAGQMASTRQGKVSASYPSKAEGRLLSAWFHAHFIHRLWKAYQRCYSHTIYHK